MAFTFVPPFNEGDKQINPETGVEYIYSEGAWRALGPKIEDEFGTLDERYLKLSGGQMTGGLLLGNSRNLTFRKADDSDQFAINPNVNSDYFTNIYSFNSADGNGGVRFRVSQDQGVGSASYDTLVSLSGTKQNIGGVEYRGTLALNRVQTPDSPDQAANKWYVDNAVGDVDLSEYLPLAGGTMTGRLILDRPGNGDGFTVKGQDASGDEINLLTAYHNSSGNIDAINYNGRTDNDNNLANLGWVKTWTDDYLLKSGGTMTGTFTSNANTNQRINFLTNGSSANCDISRNGTWQFSIQDGKTKVATQVDMTNHKIINVSAPSNAKDAANKEYVDNASSSIDGGHFYVSSGSLYFEFD